MNTRTFVLGTFFLALLGINLSFSQTPNSKPASTVPPAIITKPVENSSDLTVTAKSPTPPQTVNDDDINRFTNTIALIKDFYVQPTGDKTLLDDAIRGMVAGLD